MAKTFFMLAFLIWFLAVTSVQGSPIAQASTSINVACKHDSDCANFNQCGPGRGPCKRYCFIGVCWCTCGSCCDNNKNNVTHQTKM
ncbi:hypothetical protein Lalb_Chr18g0047171 [Lupinus albus]|uniref:Uncharacterized protein n=1 Tax=Lupinus albus TaxID=3870 RepID=A0A6A4NSW3_LUPAL|nr:hypothetical protein Lalb_Chr18g0047171 [Lupinus albus]